MKYVVTGAAGFIGSNLVKEILARGDEVLGVDNMVNGREENIAEFRSDPNFDFMQEDITNEEVCKHACFRADYVLHQAALGSVPRSVEQPLLVNDNNVRSTLQMLCAARDMGVKRFVFASSASIYGDIDRYKEVRGKFRSIRDFISVKTDERSEIMSPAPTSPYAISKLACEEYVKCFKALYGLQTVALRYFNVFGPRQSPTGAYAAVVPKFIDAMRNNQQITIDGDGKQFRDFTFVENVVNANLLACQADEDACGKFYNVGVGGRTTINELFFELAELLKGGKADHGPARAGDVFGSIADLNQVRTGLKYEPEIDFKEGLRRTVEWHLNRS